MCTSLDTMSYMVWAEFEEKEYEIAATIDLAYGGSTPHPVFGSGQVLEKIVGYDAAANPDESHVIWSILAVPRPRGVRLTPTVWAPGVLPPPDRLPTSPVSLILQYKRPEFLRGARARQWHRWRAPYFRFTRSRAQQRVLLRIERAMGSAAVVRYATPAFWTRGELEGSQLYRSTLRQSGFVAPSTLGTHFVWSYRSPGTFGYVNPGGRRARFDGLDALFESLFAAQAPAAPVPYGDVAFDAHLEILAGAVGAREPLLRAEVTAWASSLRTGGLPLDELTLLRLERLATVQSMMSRLGASWHMRSR